MPLVGILLQEVRKEEELEDEENDEELDCDNNPKCTPDGHLPEAIVIQVKDPLPEARFAVHEAHILGFLLAKKHFFCESAK